MKLRVTRLARADLGAILRESRNQFGVEAQIRYERLLKAAMRELATNPYRPGAREAADAEQEGMWVYHSRHTSRRLPAAERVGRSRHLLVYRVADDEVRILRILHDAMDIPAWLQGQ